MVRGGFIKSPKVEMGSTGISCREVYVIPAPPIDKPESEDIDRSRRDYVEFCAALLKSLSAADNHEKRFG